MRITGKLIRAELRLFLREPSAMAFVVAFPVVTVLILGGVFDPDDPAFGGATPSDYYVAAYFGVVIAAVGLIMIPVHVASYRERGVLRRFDAAGMPRWAFPLSQLVNGLLFIGIGAAAVWITGLLSYGVPPVHDLPRTLLGAVSGALAFVTLGVLLGLLVPTARAAQGIGTLLYFPMFLLAGAGPPPEVMTGAMNDVATFLPLTHVVRAIQEPWLGFDGGTDHVLVVLAVFAAAALWSARLLGLVRGPRRRPTASGGGLALVGLAAGAPSRCGTIEIE